MLTRPSCPFANNPKQRGSTIIEIVLATTVIALVLITITSTLVLVLRNQRVSSNQQAATKYAQEVLEWVRQVRDANGWDAYYTAVNGDGASSTHCMQTTPATTTVTAYQSLSDIACGDDDVIDDSLDIFKRELSMTVNAANKITAVVTVSWTDGNKDFKSELDLVLRDWQ